MAERAVDALRLLLQGERSVEVTAGLEDDGLVGELSRQTGLVVYLLADALRLPRQAQRLFQPATLLEQDRPMTHGVGEPPGVAQIPVPGLQSLSATAIASSR